MANPFDAASRLAEGQPAVDDVEEYVAACHRLGYQHPDLTVHATQVGDWYASEDGLDLRVLDADSCVLSTVAAAAEDAARTQANLVVELSAGWSGRGAAAAHEFVWRSGQAAGVVSVAIRAAADAAATLRDALWRAVDAKVAATQAIEHRAQRTEWLAAARTVTSGAGDLAAASELIDQQVKPFVDQAIGTDWLAAMRTANASISAAYANALASTTGAPRAMFDVPGELGPRPEAHDLVDERRGGERPSFAGQTIPAAAVGSTPVPVAPSVMPLPPIQPAAPWSGSAPAAPLPLADPMAQAPAAPMSPASSSMPSMPSMPSVGDLGAGTSSLGTGLSGFGQQLADLIGGLVGSPDEGPPGPGDVEEPDVPDDPDARDDPEAADDEPKEPKPDEGPPAEETEGAAAECGEAADDPAPQPTPVPTVVEYQPDPPPEPPAVPEAAAVTAEPTPCEIAADELPQVGE